MTKRKKAWHCKIGNRPTTKQKICATWRGQFVDTFCDFEENVNIIHVNQEQKLEISCFLINVNEEIEIAFSCFAKNYYVLIKGFKN